MATIECPGEMTVDSTVTVSITRFRFSFSFGIYSFDAREDIVKHTSRVRAFIKAVREVNDGYRSARCQSGCRKLPMGPISGQGVLDSYCELVGWRLFIKCTTKVNLSTLVQCEQSEEENFA